MAERIDCRTVPERPLPKGPFYVHPNAKYVGSDYDGCCDEYECPDCGTEFSVELPE
jgi:hypothetical protein